MVHCSCSLSLSLKNQKSKMYNSRKTFLSSKKESIFPRILYFKIFKTNLILMMLTCTSTCMRSQYISDLFFAISFEGLPDKHCPQGHSDYVISVCDTIAPQVLPSSGAWEINLCEVQYIYCALNEACL